jgi:hypothetical protein
MLTPGSYQFNDRFSTQTQGGILVYYVSAQPGKITAFKPVSKRLLPIPPPSTLTSARASACSSATPTCARAPTPS